MTTKPRLTLHNAKGEELRISKNAEPSAADLFNMVYRDEKRRGAWPVTREMTYGHWILLILVFHIPKRMMKHLTAFTCLFATLTLSGVAQELKTEKKTLSRNLDEVYQIDPANKKIKEGLYKVIDVQKHTLVIGNFKDGKKDSVWTYYNNWQEPIQQFDFTNHKLAYEKTDSSTTVNSSFQIFGTKSAGDRLQPPHKIGGANYGFFLLFDARDIPQEVRTSTDRAIMSYIFSISDQGELLGWQVVYKGRQMRDIVQNKSIKGLPADAYEFVPAMINDHPVNSQLILSVVIDVDHIEIPGNNNMPTQKPTRP
jgi:hypothetical protein